MQKLSVTKFLTSLMVLLMIMVSLVPAVAEARSGDGVVAESAVIHYQEGEGEAEGGSSLAGTGIALGLIGFILLLLAVVAVIGAASLGIIGLGYWQSESGD